MTKGSHRIETYLSSVKSEESRRYVRTLGATCLI